MHGWTSDDRTMIACCNYGTRPVIFFIERIDILETEEEREWLQKQDFSNTADEGYTGLIRFFVKFWGAKVSMHSWRGHALNTVRVLFRCVC